MLRISRANCVSYRRKTLIAALALLALTGCQALQRTDVIPAPPAPIEIVGDERFTQQVRSALSLLAERAPDEFREISRYVGRIRHAERSGMRAYDEPPTYELADPTAFYSVSWCAGTIAHDAFHSKLYHDYRAEHGEPVPSDVWTGQRAEQRCNAFQLAVLRKVRAPDREIDWMLSQDGSHADVNGDGTIDARDYLLRNW